MMALRRRHRRTAIKEETNIANAEEGSEDGVYLNLSSTQIQAISQTRICMFDR